MKLLSSRIAAAAAAILAISTLTGVAESGSASASSYTHLCAYNPEFGTSADACLQSNGIGLRIGSEVAQNGTTNWTYPNTNGAKGEIKQANVNLCMQVNASDSDYVRGATCIGDAAEEWINFYNTQYHKTMFKSVWNSSLCLTIPGTGFAQVVTCSTSNVAQQWSS